MEKFSVGLVQMSCWADPAENLAKAVRKVGVAARQGAKIVCLPELFKSRYFCQREDPAVFDLAERVPGPMTSTRPGGAGKRRRGHGQILFTSGANAGLLKAVKSYAGQFFTFNSPLPFVPNAGDLFTAYPGCDKTQATCSSSKFNNLVNFEGFPYVPAPETAI